MLAVFDAVAPNIGQSCAINGAAAKVADATARASTAAFTIPSFFFDINSVSFIFPPFRNIERVHKSYGDHFCPRF
jgi:hypothetical protein